jgi:MFS family permease
MSEAASHNRFDEDIKPGSIPDRLASSPRYGWYVVAMLWFISFFNYADRQAIFSVFPLLEKEFGLNLIQKGWLGSSFAIVYGLGAPFAGYVIDHIRRKTAILFGLHIWSIICMATALSQNFRHLIIFRAAEGAGETFYYPASMSLVSDFHGKRTRSRAMGLHQTSVYIGTIGGGFFAGLIGQYYGWRLSFIVFGGLGILLGFLLHKVLLEPKRGAADLQDMLHTEQPAAMAKLPLMDTLRVIWSTPTVLTLLGAFICANFVAMVLLTWMPSYLHDNFGMSLATSGLTATMYVQLASMCGAPLGGYLADRLRGYTPRGRMIVQCVGVLCGAPFVALCGMTQSIPGLLVALTFWGLFKGIYDANIFASMFDVIRPEARGTAAGLMNCMGWLLGAFPAPIIIGIIGTKHGLGFAIATASMVYVMSGVFLLIGIVFLVKRDSAKMQSQVAQAAS